MLLNAVFLIETFNTSAGLRRFLLPGIEWMALRADLHVDLLLGRTGYKGIPAVAGYCSLIIIWMDSLFHDFHLFYLIVINRPLFIPVCPIRI